MNMIKVQPVTLPLSGEIIEQAEVFDPRVIPARPAIPADGDRAAVPAFLGTVSCIVRFYDRIGNQVGQPLRNSKTELTADQYAAWTDAVTDDVSYFTDCIVANLGLTKVA